jgi:GT2 family glycosyltransferase
MLHHTTAVICTINRPAILDETLRSLIDRARFGGQIIVSAGSEASVLRESEMLPYITVMHGVKGLPVQRNAALRLVKSKYVLFLDDDVELGANYVCRMEALFDQYPQIVIACGWAVLDTSETRSVVTREMATRALMESGDRAGWEDTPRWIRGHNMFSRTEVARIVGFDERLPLYGLYEDLDFVARCQRHGKAVRNLEARVAHLGTLSGRINEVQLGYSQFANSFYLARKGVWATRVVARIVTRQLGRNLWGSFVVRETDLVHRRSRLKGNLLAIADVFRGRLDPRNILAL